MKILAIDDQQDNLAALTAMLRTFLPGCEIAIADTGETGIKLAHTFRPDTILLDIKMPGMDGFQVCRALKSNLTTRHIPVIFLTAQRTDPTSRIRGIEMGGDAFLTKPLETEELLAQVHSMVRIKLAEDKLRNEVQAMELVIADRTAALQAEVRNLNAIFNASPVAMLVLDENMNIVRMNKTAVTLVDGISDQQNIRLGNFLRCINVADNPQGCGAGPACMVCLLRNVTQTVVVSGNALHGVEHAMKVDRDGCEQNKWLRIEVEPISLAGRRHVVIALDDITAYKQTEKAPRQRQAQPVELAGRSGSRRNCPNCGKALHPEHTGETESVPQ